MSSLRIIRIIRASDEPHRKNESLRPFLNLQPVAGHHKCGNCQACSSTLEGTEFIHKQERWKQIEFSTCKTRNVVYAIVCPCQLVYIGKTFQEIRQRISQHRSRIKNKVPIAPLVMHFQEKGHTEKDFYWTVLNAIKLDDRGGDPEGTLLQSEAYLIMKFNSATSGLNEMSETNRL